MNSTIGIVIAFAATLLIGMAIGFMIGLAKGMSLGARFRSGRPVSALPSILCFIGSGIFLLVALGSSIYSFYFIANSAQTEAMVTEIIERKDDEGRVRRTPVYSYTAASGNMFTDRSSIGDGRELAIGDTIPVRYLKDSPHQSRIDYFSHHWLLPVFMAAFSVGLAGLGFGLRWWRRQEQQWANERMEQSGWPVSGSES